MKLRTREGELAAVLDELQKPRCDKRAPHVWKQRWRPRRLRTKTVRRTNADAKSAIKDDEAASGDASTLAAIEQEGVRLARRQERHARDRKRMATRMVNTGGDGDAMAATSGPTTIFTISSDEGAGAEDAATAAMTAGVASLQTSHENK